MAKYVDAIIRFNQKYVVDEETGCWNWTACIDKEGYGRIRIENKMFLSHRFSYEYFNGPLIKGLVCCHSCHNRSCVNPKHIRLDTLKSNSLDMVNAKRHWEQILSFKEVIEIKSSLKNYYHGQIKDLAHFYKVTPSTISHIKKGKSWSHVVID